MKKLTIGLLFFAFSLAVNAGEQWCNGTISHTYLTSSGELVINGSWRQQHTKICNINTEWKGVSTETCKGWFSLATVAKVSRAKVIVYYSNTTSCAEIPAYGSAPNPGYVMLSE